jgi:hypothetical protein
MDATHIKYSFALPSRGRPELLKRYLKSIHENAKDKDCFEVLLRIDDDDKATHDLFKNEDFPGKENTIVFSGIRLGYDHFYTVWDRFYKMFRGKAYIHLIADDFVFLVKDFDVVFEKFLDKPCVFGWQARNGVTKKLMEQDWFFGSYGGQCGKCDTRVWQRAKALGLYEPTQKMYRRLNAEDKTKAEGCDGGWQLDLSALVNSPMTRIYG